jgi:hypothetical protein
MLSRLVSLYLPWICPRGPAVGISINLFVSTNSIWCELMYIHANAGDQGN